MRRSLLSLITRLATVAVLLPAAVGVATTLGAGPAASAPSPRTWWVAASGSANDPGTSCGVPDVSGSTHVAIQNALDQAADGDTIRLCPGTYAISVTLTVANDVTISGFGVAATILDGGSTTRIMSIMPTVTSTSGVTIDSMQFRNGRITGENNSGGAIGAHPDAKLTVVDSLFRGNRATDQNGGAIAMIKIDDGTNDGTLHVVGSTFVENHAGLDGGAIDTTGMLDPDPTITNSTFVGNTVGRAGGAVNASFGETQVTHSTFLDNRTGDVGAAVYKASVANSLVASSAQLTMSLCSENEVLTANVTTDASCAGAGGSVHAVAELHLTVLGLWGGTTPTVAIGATSAAIGAVTSNCAVTDQRGISRGDTCDAGAFEYVDGVATLTASPVTLKFLAGQPLADYAAPTGLSAPTFRLASELSSPLPDGATVSSADGRLVGAPLATATTGAFLVTGTGDNGSMANMWVYVDDCPLEQDENGALLIATNSALAVLRDGLCGWDADYRLTADIAWNGPWEGVGTSAERFTGTIDGGGHAITGLDIAGGEYAAFVSYADGATISALTITVEVEGGYGSAGLLGYADRTHVVDVHGSGTVTGVMQPGDADWIGCTAGLVGESLDHAVIADSSFVGTVSDPHGDWVGGLVGCTAWPATVARSWFTGSVTGNATVGALVGWMSDAEIVDSFAVGEVTGNNYVGGLVGHQGFAQHPAGTIDVTNSYASVTVSSSGGIAGGLIGSGESTAIEASFWNGGITTDAVVAVGAAHDIGDVPTGSAATNPEDLRSHSFLAAAGWAIVDGWQDPSTTATVWGVCELVGRPFHLRSYEANPCGSTPEPQLDTPGSIIPTLGSSDPTNTAGPATSTATQTPTRTNTSQTTPSTPSPTGTPTPVGSLAPATDPALRVGELTVLVDRQPVDAVLTWGQDGSLAVNVGEAQIGLGFEQTIAGTASRGRLRQGRPLRLDLTGLRPGSPVTATLFSTPTRLGSMIADGSGAVSGSVIVPTDAAAGSHRIRLEITDRTGKAIELWLGVEVQPANLQLPATGTFTPIKLAAVLVSVGALLLSRPVRRRGNPSRA